MPRDYYRRFVRRWCGGVDDDCRFRIITEGAWTGQCPRAVNGVVEVGAAWLRGQRVPVEALADEVWPGRTGR
jgi:hypothetical protein